VVRVLSADLETIVIRRQSNHQLHYVQGSTGRPLISGMGRPVGSHA
jgi:hypothetical protein